MKKTEQDLSGDDILLEEPHFDEESTILSARPVVPLQVVEAKSRSLRRILIGSALVMALLVGAFAASFVYRLRSGQQASDVVATEDSPAQSQVVLKSGVAALEPPDPEPVVEPEEPEPTVLDKKRRDEPAVVKNVPAKSSPSISREPTPRVPRTAVRSRRDEPIEEDLASRRELNQEIRRAERREERRQERREERRARRVEEANHQGRDRDSRSTDDLLRIREIFEGRPRP